MYESNLPVSAEFNPDVRKYWLVVTTIVLLVTVIGIPFLLLWLPLGMYFTQKFLDRMQCTLTRKTLILRKGILNRIEKTVPLEKITDLGLQEGPLMRLFGVKTLTVETAGQSSQGALVSICGIVDVEAFRERVLAQRDALEEAKAKRENTPEPEARSAGSHAESLLAEIRDTLKRIENNMKP